jgi:hypothetical protein
MLSVSGDVDAPHIVMLHGCFAIRHLRNLHEPSLDRQILGFNSASRLAATAGRRTRRRECRLEMITIVLHRKKAGLRNARVCSHSLSSLGRKSKTYRRFAMYALRERGFGHLRPQVAAVRPDPSTFAVKSCASTAPMSHARATRIPDVRKCEIAGHAPPSPAPLLLLHPIEGRPSPSPPRRGLRITGDPPCPPPRVCRDPAQHESLVLGDTTVHLPYLLAADDCPDLTRPQQERRPLTVCTIVPS